MHPAFSSPQHSTHNDFSDKENTIPHVNFSQASMKENIDNNTLFVESAFIPPPPGRVIFCKARGMNLDHVGNNAVLTFDTGFDFVHGAELKCSHSVCRRDGVKFRYCKHCDKAVAKRNFRKRHAHPEIPDESSRMNTPMRPDLMMPVLSRNPFPSDVCMPALPAVYPPSYNNVPAMMNMYHPAHNFGHVNNMNTTNVSASLSIYNRPEQGAFPPQMLPNTQPIQVPVNNGPVVPNEWSNLFLSRPLNGTDEEKNAWVEEVVRVSGVHAGQDTNIDEKKEEGKLEVRVPTLKEVPPLDFDVSTALGSPANCLDSKGSVGTFNFFSL